jgi:hypothetical protein
MKWMPRDPSNIAFVPENLEESRVPENLEESHRFLDQFVNHDLRELGLFLLGSLEARRHQLLSVLGAFKEAEALR